jgi:Putative mono-oxygenase ydhR
MITAIVQYKLPPDIDQAACAAHFRAIAPRFRDVPGLIRKHFIYADDGWAGGVYLWETRAAAEAFYSGPWLAGIRERYGMDPQIKFFETASITDNAAGVVLLPDAAAADLRD